jgi:hypothetical protein
VRREEHTPKRRGTPATPPRAGKESSKVLDEHVSTVASRARETAEQVGWQPFAAPSRACASLGVGASRTCPAMPQRWWPVKRVPLASAQLKKDFFTELKKLQEAEAARQRQAKP